MMVLLAVVAACGSARNSEPPPPTAPTPATTGSATKGDDVILGEVRAWLAHPQEYGRPPARAAIIWRERRAWPFHDTPVDVFLVDYAYDDGRRGIAVTGPVTWTFLDMAFDRISHADLATLYAGWYLNFVMLQDPKGRAAQARAATVEQVVAALEGQGLASIEVLDRLQIGDETYVAARATKVGVPVIVAGRMVEVKTYDPALPQLTLPPLFWYLGSTFNEM